PALTTEVYGALEDDDRALEVDLLTREEDLGLPTDNPALPGLRRRQRVLVRADRAVDQGVGQISAFADDINLLSDARWHIDLGLPYGRHFPRQPTSEIGFAVVVLVELHTSEPLGGVHLVNDAGALLVLQPALEIGDPLVEICQHVGDGRWYAHVASIPSPSTSASGLAPSSPAKTGDVVSAPAGGATSSARVSSSVSPYAERPICQSDSSLPT